MTVVATVGTTHPLAFAGLPHALLMLAEDGVRPVCVVAGVSAQDARGVLHLHALPAEAIAKQFEALRDAGVDAFHVGALLSAEAVEAVADGLATFPGVPVVVDPVLAATGGDALCDEPARAALVARLFPLAALVTPNAAEAGLLLGREVRDLAAMHAAAPALLALGAPAVLVKGGDLGEDAVDVFADPRGVRELRAPRIPGELRGTGDLLAASIAAALANEASLPEAIERARRRVREAIARGVPFAGTRVATWRTR